MLIETIAAIAIIITLVGGSLRFIANIMPGAKSSTFLPTLTSAAMGNSNASIGSCHVVQSRRDEVPSIVQQTIPSESYFVYKGLNLPNRELTELVGYCLKLTLQVVLMKGDSILLSVANGKKVENSTADGEVDLYGATLL